MKLYRLATIFLLGLLSITLPVPIGFRGTAEPQAVWPAVDLEEVTAGLEAPVHLTHAADGSQRLFVVEQRGRIRIVQNETVLDTPFLDISDRVLSPFSNGGSEEGLLSVAFPPGYAQKGYFYVYYTNRQENNQVSRFRLSSNPNVADPESEEPILNLEHPIQDNHNGGQLAFGPDGYLYIGTGDGGGGGDPYENAQNPASLLGKLLRIDVEPDPAPPPPAAEQVFFFPLILKSGGSLQAAPAYQIPADNPYVGQPGYRGEIWALGLRNPWRFSFDRQTGDLFIADVGQGDWEEIDFQPRASPGGENYGWDIMEGPDCFEPASCNPAGLVAPVFAYQTHSGGTCAITGGFVYRGQAQHGLQGIYIYGDYCNGQVWGLQADAGAWANQELEDTGFRLTSFGEGEDGEIYALDERGGLYRVVVDGG